MATFIEIERLLLQAQQLSHEKHVLMHKVEEIENEIEEKATKVRELQRRAAELKKKGDAEKIEWERMEIGKFYIFYETKSILKMFFFLLENQIEDARDSICSVGLSLPPSL